MSRHDAAADQMRSRSDGWWYAKARCRLPSNGLTSVWHPLEWCSAYARQPRQPEHQRQFAVDRHDTHPSALRDHPAQTGVAICDRVFMHAQLFSDILALQALRTQQDHPAPIRQRTRRPMPTHLRFEETSIGITQNDDVRLPANHVQTPAIVTEAKQNEAYFTAG